MTTPLASIVRHVLERAAKAAKDRHEVWEAGDGFHDADGFPAVSCDVTACENIATAILALPIDQIATEVEAMLPGYQMLPQAAETGSSRPDDASASREGGHGAADAPSQPDQAKVAALVGDMRRIAEGNLGDEPWQANYARIKQVATEALDALANLETPQLTEYERKVAQMQEDFPNGI